KAITINGQQTTWRRQRGCTAATTAATRNMQQQQKQQQQQLQRLKAAGRLGAWLPPMTSLWRLPTDYLAQLILALCLLGCLSPFTGNKHFISPHNRGGSFSILLSYTCITTL
ncbi:uncharacterized protein Dyak_GE29050, partial [Drosophila yakuba]